MDHEEGWHPKSCKAELSEDLWFEETDRLSESAEADPDLAKRKALWWACAVFFGWTVAGLVGALLWFLLFVFLIVGQAGVEARSKSSSKKKSNGGLLPWLLLGGLLLINEETLRSTEEKVDEFVIKLAVLITFLIVLVVIVVNG